MNSTVCLSSLNSRPIHPYISYSRAFEPPLLALSNPPTHLSTHPLTLAPFFMRYSMVGTVARIRVSSVIFFPSRGTFRSTRTNTRLPLRSAVGREKVGGLGGRTRRRSLFLLMHEVGGGGGRPTFLEAAHGLLGHGHHTLSVRGGADGGSRDGSGGGGGEAGEGALEEGGGHEGCWVGGWVGGFVCGWGGR